MPLAISAGFGGGHTFSDRRVHKFKQLVVFLDRRETDVYNEGNRGGVQGNQLSHWQRHKYTPTNLNLQSHEISSVLTQSPAPPSPSNPLLILSQCEIVIPCASHGTCGIQIDMREVRAKKPSLTLNLGTNGLKVTTEPPPMAGQDRSAVTHPSSSHARLCLIRLSNYIPTKHNKYCYNNTFFLLKKAIKSFCLCKLPARPLLRNMTRAVSVRFWTSILYCVRTRPRFLVVGVNVNPWDGSSPVMAFNDDDIGYPSLDCAKSSSIRVIKGEIPISYPNSAPETHDPERTQLSILT
ncbi:hypothetical protein J6590_054437 [Homalodisca vitripennis]|nr:hypothetical protein J6590_054437 [Homalodisca vitripennis]